MRLKLVDSIDPLPSNPAAPDSPLETWFFGNVSLALDERRFRLPSYRAMLREQEAATAIDMAAKGVIPFDGLPNDVEDFNRGDQGKARGIAEADCRQAKAPVVSTAEADGGNIGSHGVLQCSIEPGAKFEKPTFMVGDGWIEWSGGKCPVSDDASVKVRFRDGGFGLCGGGGVKSSELANEWAHSTPSQDNHIVAYRVLSEPKKAEPVADAEGWIKHDGKGCPLPRGTAYEMRRRGGRKTYLSSVDVRDLTEFSSWNWVVEGKPEISDVIEYRVIKAPEPKPRHPMMAEHERITSDSTQYIA